MTRIILLGGSGFIGKALLPMLQKEQFQILRLVHNKQFPTDIDAFKGDICIPGLLDEHIQDNDIIVNLIGQTENDSSKFIDNNIIGALNLLNSCIKKKNIRIILISSIAVYGENSGNLSKESDQPNPQSTYGLVKSVTEKLYNYYSKLYGINVTVLRLSTLYGPFKKTGYFSQLLQSIKTGEQLIAYNNGMQKRDILFVDDAAKGIIQAIKNHENGYVVYNISSGRQYVIKELIELIEYISNKKLDVLFNSQIPDERCLSADNSLAKINLQFNPQTKLEDGLRTTIDYFLNTM